LAFCAPSANAASAVTAAAVDERETMRAMDIVISSTGRVPAPAPLP
jgi:hypothetical protein